MRLEEKFRFCAGASQNLAPKLRRALRAFNLPEPFQGLLKAFQGPAAVGRPSRGSKEASRKGPIQKETPAARKFRFCAGGRLRPEGLLIVSILHAGVCLEVCQGLLRSLPGARKGPPRGLPGASQGPPRGLPGASQGPPRGLPGASLGPPRTSRTKNAQFLSSGPG